MSKAYISLGRLEYTCYFIRVAKLYVNPSIASEEEVQHLMNLYSEFSVPKPIPQELQAYYTHCANSYVNLADKLTKDGKIKHLPYINRINAINQNPCYPAEINYLSMVLRDVAFDKH